LKRFWSFSAGSDRFEIDPPRADDRQLRQIHLVGGDAVAAEESIFGASGRFCAWPPWVLAAPAPRPARPSWRAPAMLGERRQHEGRGEERERTAGSAHDHLLMSVSVPYFGLGLSMRLEVRVLQVHEIDVSFVTGVLDVESGTGLIRFIKAAMSSSTAS